MRDDTNRRPGWQTALLALAAWAAIGAAVYAIAALGREVLR